LCENAIYQVNYISGTYTCVIESTFVNYEDLWDTVALSVRVDGKIIFTGILIPSVDVAVWQTRSVVDTVVTGVPLRHKQHFAKMVRMSSTQRDFGVLTILPRKNLPPTCRFDR